MKFQTLIALAASTLTATAAPLTSAEITKVVNDVRVLQPSKPATAASLGSQVGGSSSIQTGRQSRAELTFADQTVARIGANSLFSFTSGSRDMEIKDGSFLLKVPKNAGGATIRTATVTAGITGTTTLMEYIAGKYVKFITLEGTAVLSLKNSKAKRNVPPGTMVIFHPDAKEIPEPVVINVPKLIRTSHLVGMGPLGDADPLIDRTVKDQLVKRRNGDLNPSGIIIQGPGSRSGKVNPDPRTRPIWIPPAPIHRKDSGPNTGGQDGIEYPYPFFPQIGN